MRMKIILFCLLLLTPLSAQEKVKVVSKQIKGGGFAFYAANPYLYPVQIEISFPRFTNLKSSVRLPFRGVLKAGAPNTLLFSVKTAKQGRYGYSMSYLVTPGDPSMKPDPKAVYRLPFAHGTKHKVGQGYFGTFSHSSRFGEYAIDFDMKEGTPILASREGLVVEIKQDSSIRGLTSAYAKHGNFILIYHKDGTFARYLHLKYRGCIVRPGDRVRAGQKIGYSGNTGWTSGPHLHFQVSRPVPGRSITIPTDFLLYKGKKGRLTAGRYYYGWQPGKSAFRRTFGRLLSNKDFTDHRKRAPFTNDVKIRTRQIDDTVILYAVNGKKTKVTIKVEASAMRNTSSTKQLPCSRTVPPLTEVFLFIIRSADPTKQWSYGYRYSYSW